MLGLPIYKLGNVYYLHTRIAGQQVKKSLRTGYKREALQRALALLHDMTKPTPFPPTKYELDASRGIFKADGPEDHARLMEAIEALKALHTGQPQAPAPIAAPTAPAPAPADDPTALRLDELLEKYFLLKKVTQATVISYRKTADELSVFLRNPRITRITTSDITRFQEHLAQKGNGLRTVANKTDTIRALLNFAKKQGYMRQDNPAAGRSLVSKKQKLKESWATFETDEIVSLVGCDFFREKLGTDYATAVLMGIFTACRVGEITALKKDDFKRSRNGTPYITIRESKTVAGIREVPLHPYIFSHISAKLDTLKNPSDKFFSYKERDGKGTGNAAGKMLARNLEAVKIERPKLVFHSLRKYTNNELMQGGVSLEHRCQFAGHEIDNVNVAIYTKPFGIDELAAAVFPTLTTIAETVAKAISGAPDFEVDFSELIDPM